MYKIMQLYAKFVKINVIHIKLTKIQGFPSFSGGFQGHTDYVNNLVSIKINFISFIV